VNQVGQNSVIASTHGTVTTGVWSFVVCSHDTAADMLRISVNAGAENTTSHSAGMAQSTSQFRLGNWQNTVDWAMNGAMQRVGFWKRVLTADERTYLYNGGRGRDYPFI